MRNSIKAIHEGGIWGRGFGMPNEKLPFIHSEMIFTYLTYSMGWVMGGLIVAAAIALAIHVGGMIRGLRDRYAKALVIGLFSILCLQFVWVIGMSFGLLPIIAVTLPFISYGSSYTTIELLMMGIMLSIYRRKDMVGSLGDSTSPMKTRIE
nr:FtsW/RodA/SpoVE family cell cycle protein [Paenibacillus sp. NEAU-GSW1]